MPHSLAAAGGGARLALVREMPAAAHSPASREPAAPTRRAVGGARALFPAPDEARGRSSGSPPRRVE